MRNIYDNMTRNLSVLFADGFREVVTGFYCDAGDVDSADVTLDIGTLFKIGLVTCQRQFCLLISARNVSNPLHMDIN